MLLIVTIVLLLLVWTFDSLHIWGFEPRPLLIVFLVSGLLIQLLFRSRTRYR